MEGSYNQANVSTQTINNTNTEGDLNQTKNTNAFNTNAGNSNGSNVTQNPEAKAGALAIVGATQVGVRTGTTQIATGGTNVAYTNNQVRQTPMAWSPAIAMSQSQENCNVSASLGVGSPTFSISGGIPIRDSDCNRRRDAIFWMNVRMNEVACNRMVQDPANKKALEDSGQTCHTATLAQTRSPMLVTPSTLNAPQNAYWDKQDKIADAQLSALYKQRMVK
jgi:hypothetical protein